MEDCRLMFGTLNEGRNCRTLFVMLISNFGLEALHMFGQGSYGGEGQECVQEAWLPPVFSESPPCRVANPLVQDARFGKATSASPRSIPAVPSGLSSSQSPSSRTGGCMRGSFGAMPMVRVEGFDCVDKDGWNCSIPALA